MGLDLRASAQQHDDAPAVVACFGLHDAPRLQALSEKWLLWLKRPGKLPLLDIRNYFG
jgi:hypothetical protein